MLIFFCKVFAEIFFQYDTGLSDYQLS